MQRVEDAWRADAAGDRLAAEPIDRPLAGRAGADPRCGGLLDLPRVITTLSVAPDGQSEGPPHASVPCSAAGESVSDLVENGVADFCLAVQFNQMPGQADRLRCEHAESESPAGVVEREGPISQLVLRHEGLGQ